MDGQKKRAAPMILAVMGGLLVTGTVVYVMISTLSSGSALEYFKNVDEAVAQLDRLKDRRLRLHGNVVAGTIQKKPDTLDYRFAVFHRDKWVEVTYTGLVPDTFKDCAEVVVKGKFLSEGHFAADNVTAKCPSKYDEKQRITGCGEKIKPLVLASRQR